MLCALTKHAAIFGSLWLQYRIFPKGISTAVLPVREKTIGVIAIVEMCEKCSHFRLMLAVEEMKIAQPETREKYFVYYKENFERPPRGNTLKLTRVMWKSTQTSIICCCLFKRRILFTCSIDRLLVFLIVYPFILTHLKKIYGLHTTCSYCFTFILISGVNYFQQ